MSRNFQVRVACGLGLFIVAVIAMYTFNGIPFKVLAVLFALMATAELLSFLTKKHKTSATILVLIELAFLIGCLAFILQLSTLQIWLVMFGVCGYDIFAYLCGRMLGGKIIKKHRPFPKISKNKTWEGTVLGLAFSVGLVGLLLFLTHSMDYIFLLCGPLAMIGDLFESYMKRQFKIKDSNEIVVKNPVFDKLEFIVGEKEGHGGFLDRVDSAAFACTILLIITLLI